MEIDLKRHYIDFNKKYFEGKLPLPSKISMSKRLTRATGITKYTIQRDTRKTNPESLQIMISDLYQMSEEQIIEVLLHEMIHVWVAFVENLPEYGHGTIFLNKLKEVSAKSGIEIPISHDSSKLQIQRQSKDPFIVMLFEYGENKSISVMSLNHWKKNQEQFIQWIKVHSTDRIKVSVYKSDSPELIKYPKTLKLKRFNLPKMYRPTPQILKSLNQKNKIL